MRIHLHEADSNKLAQLRAHYATMKNGFIPAHTVIIRAIDALHKQTFDEKNCEIPENWEFYDK
jgi:hypothetical protein